MNVDESQFLGAPELNSTSSPIAPRPKSKAAEQRASAKEEKLVAIKPAVDVFSGILAEEKKKATDIRTYTDGVINDASSDGIAVIVEIRARKLYVNMIEKLEILLKEAGGNEQQF